MPPVEARCRAARGARRPAGALEAEVMVAGRGYRLARVPGGATAPRAGERSAPRVLPGAGD